LGNEKTSRKKKQLKRESGTNERKRDRGKEVKDLGGGQRQDLTEAVGELEKKLKGVESFKKCRGGGKLSLQEKAITGKGESQHSWPNPADNDKNRNAGKIEIEGSLRL